MNQDLKRIARGFVLIAGLGAAACAVVTSGQFAAAVTRVDATINAQPVQQGHFVNENLSDFPWSLSPALAESNTGGSKLKFAIADTPYMPTTKEGIDDYHCFLVNPGFTRDGMVTGVNILPDNAKVVHHVILYKIEGALVQAAMDKDKASGGKGWTCFGGPNVGSPTSGGNWLGAWAPGSSGGALPAGIGVPVKKDSLLVMQMHYNLANGAMPDRSSAELTLAPEGEKLKPLKTNLLFAPVELPCGAGLSTTDCKRETVMAENAKKFGAIGEAIPRLLLSACKRNLEEYQNAGDASRVTTSCDNPVRVDATIYSVAGHMHLRGTDIKLELNPGTNGAKTLLHIPKWDFHWQGNYWFKTPVEVKQGDIIKVTCTYDNSTANQPMIGDKPATPRYIVWGEGTTDEMCLGVMMSSPKPQQ
jgi:Copper type II ascorbate-dependent monooxygenase, C-terminal domain/Copper type II ascorbate-dependent monooxygenase, N-terminal domain